jgi:CelD/BcsL family acetyltransferase involved in cellulose biosynthesis
MLHFKTIQTLSDFEDMASLWNQLLSESASHVPFLRHEYLVTWWKTLGGGEWQEGQLRLITARKEQGELVGIAPLFLTHNRDGKAALMLLGSIEISDFLDLIVPPAHLTDFCRELLQYLQQSKEGGWEVLDFYNILDSSPTLPALEAAAHQLGWSYTVERLQHSPYIPLPGDWEAYLASIDKKQRHEIRRKMRRLEESGVPFRWYFVEEETQLEREIDQFLDLMALDEEKQAFLTSVMRSQMRESVRAAFRNGWLQLAFLEIEGQKAAGYLNFDFDNQIWVYNSGMDNRFNAYSPGWVLLAYLLKWANEQKRKSFDFMRGNEDYKYRFGATDRYVMRLILKP